MSAFLLSSKRAKDEADLSPVHSKNRWTLKKREIIQMLMAMDHYNVDSVILKAAPSDSFNWELPQPASRLKKK